MQRCHPGHVDPVQVDVDAGPPQHVHDGVSVTLTNVILEHDLVREADTPLAGVEPRKHRGSAGHDVSDDGVTVSQQCCCHGSVVSRSTHVITAMSRLTLAAVCRAMAVQK